MKKKYKVNSMENVYRQHGIFEFLNTNRNGFIGTKWSGSLQIGNIEYRNLGFRLWACVCVPGEWKRHRAGVQVSKVNL